MAQMAGAAGKFLDRFDTNTEEKREKCLPSAGPPPPGKVWVPGHRRDPRGVLKRSLIPIHHIPLLSLPLQENTYLVEMRAEYTLTHDTQYGTAPKVTFLLPVYCWCYRNFALFKGFA
jgi:hypothetical protein